MKPIQRALISVSDKTGVLEFARELHSSGIEILSTGGTAELLRKGGVPVIQVSDYTGFPEMMDGRIKTLHPRVHGGILGRRDVPEHMKAMEEHGIRPIDLVVINLYPFEQTVAKEGCTLEEAIENIDIGGPAMVRSSAKNCNDVTIVVDPKNYGLVLEEMKEGSVSLETRRRLSRDAFAHTARYDSLIAAFLSGQWEEEPGFPPFLNQPYTKVQDLRYGENPHQSAALYKESQPLPTDIVAAEQLQGKELSFNNYIDLNAAWELVRELGAGAVAIIKHTNPCGVAVGDDQLKTFILAREVDPTSAFGGILGFNQPVTAQVAEEILKNFVEAVVAPGFEPEAIKLFSAKKNIRLMQMPATELNIEDQRYDLKRISGGLLVQSQDSLNYVEGQLKIASDREPTAREMEDMKFAWLVAKHVKSNAIIYAKDNEILGIGAGQMSRVDSARVAVEKARKSLSGAVMASDAFFPFRDSVDEAAKNGISAIISPGGSIRDEEVLQAAKEHNIAMVFTGTRHFKH
ncbi:MAG: bifunctional phosphoribosylaminoimidazolecarboxamide formyltransferase/IMP cyclohydrolase [Nitrospina sp.]|jgi:phosphoribosylaminoimidazolecarboxamide formyltransferase/IMP cyclohydrolase|nr:bifunctional phosphoribosylaminoimidazolecarboxamide formyltransferase/IMP cyclohydrolase [Nitrospina sp.]MBT6717760.1 bifunctional phosphoribosylaminoimidazolecarboxamide formyltransferase/IMP cyclohydrolase [Nitrospina sp.]